MYIEPSVDPWNEMAMSSISLYFVENLFIYINERWFTILFLVASLLCSGISEMLAS
jgi:hypothetical protein